MSGLYGSKFADLWNGSNLASVKRMWAVKLAGFHAMPNAIKEALDALDSKPFPPTLPEFLTMCREAGRRHVETVQKLAHKLTPEEKERADEQAKKLTAAIIAPKHDHLNWAKFPASREGFAALIAASAADRRLRDILRQHVTDGICDEQYKLLSIRKAGAWVKL